MERVEDVQLNEPDCSEYYEILESGEYTEEQLQEAFFCEQSIGIYYKDLYEVLRTKVNIHGDF